MAIEVHFEGKYFGMLCYSDLEIEEQITGGYSYTFMMKGKVIFMVNDSESKRVDYDKYLGFINVIMKA